MSTIAPFHAVACSALFALSLALFLATAVKRHRLDRAMARAAQAHPTDKTPLDPPERRMTYDQKYLVTFIKDARSQEIASGRSALDYYARTILAWDIWFAVAFAAFISAAGLLAADWLAAWPWAARACLIFACMGVLYGIADVAEDVMLRKIFRQAEELEARQKAHRIAAAATEDEATAKQAALDDAAKADAAQVDAANALTRLKMVTMAASVIGVFVFALVFLAFDRVIKKAAAPASRIVSG